MKYLIITFFLLLKLNAFAQLEELKKNQDLRKKYISPNSSSTRLRYNFCQHVNPFIGTGAHGHTHPAATAPFGMMQLGPDTRFNGWDGCSGYHYSDSIIYGFSHTHLSGTGVEDLCDLLIVPQTGKAKIDPSYEVKNGYGASFSHKNEIAEPGYYEVTLNSGIKVQLAAAEHSGIHKYTFKINKEKKYILIDLDHRDKLLDFSLKIISKKEISGSRISKAWAEKQHFYFYLQSDHDFKKAKIIAKKGKHKLLLTFSQEINEINLKVGISAVDENGAKQNAFDELGGKDLESLKSFTQNQWNIELNKLHFQSSDSSLMTKFYTSMYHLYLCPTIFSDVDGRYRANDGEIKQSSKHTQYSIFSLWDTYRAAHPLFTLTQEKRSLSFIHSFLDIYKYGGKLPVWELNGNETNCMIGYHSVSVIADAYFKGITNFDTELALKAMIHSAEKNELGKANFNSQGFIASFDEPESVSKSLEYAYDDWCISQFAKELKDTATYLKFKERSNYFVNSFDPATKFMRPRNGGVWQHPFNPAEVNFNFTEANSFQYSLAAPQNITLLREILGGKDSLEAWLDRLFTTSSTLEGRQQADITGLIGQYAHGNEPSHHMAYLYNYTNKPYKTQEKIDQILTEMYQDTPEGLSGNEDCGQMSAWYAMSAIGLYPICPGKSSYNFGRPIQEYANFHFENGKSFYIRTLNNSPENKYIQKIELNGENYLKLYIEHQQLKDGGELIFHMGAKPNLDLKNYQNDLESTENVEILPQVYFTAQKISFEDSLQTEIKILELADFEIHYTIDGTEPSFKSPLYESALSFHETTTLKAKAFLNGKSNHLKSVENTFYKLKTGKNIRLETRFDNQYTGGGEFALIDGIFGASDFRSGPWQGYQGIDAIGVLNFDSLTSLKSLSFSCLQDIKSWIFMPTQIEVELSYDGLTFTDRIIKKINYDETKYGNFIEKFQIDITKSKEIKALRYKVINRGTCPKNHLGAGEKSWLFIDEIEIND